MVTQEINLKIHEEDELFSPYDPQKKLLSEDVLSYLERNYINKHRHLHDQFTIHIYSDTPVNEKAVKERFANYFTQEMDNTSYLLKQLTKKQIYLIVFGVVLLMIWVIMSLNLDDPVGEEIVSIMGWVAIWEATSIAIMQRPELLLTKKTYEHFITAPITIDIVSE